MLSPPNRPISLIKNLAIFTELCELLLDRNCAGGRAGPDGILGVECVLLNLVLWALG